MLDCPYLNPLFDRAYTSQGMIMCQRIVGVFSQQHKFTQWFWIPATHLCYEITCIASVERNENGDWGVLRLYGGIKSRCAIGNF